MWVRKKKLTDTRHEPLELEYKIREVGLFHQLHRRDIIMHARECPAENLSVVAECNEVGLCVQTERARTWRIARAEPLLGMHENWNEVVERRRLRIGLL